MFSVSAICSGVTLAALACSIASSINSPAPSPTPPKTVLRRSCPAYKAASSAVIGVACSPSPPRPRIFEKASPASKPAGLNDNKLPRPPDNRPLLLAAVSSNTGAALEPPVSKLVAAGTLVYCGYCNGIIIPKCFALLC